MVDYAPADPNVPADGAYTLWATLPTRRSRVCLYRGDCLDTMRTHYVAAVLRGCTETIGYKRVPRLDDNPRRMQLQQIMPDPDDVDGQVWGAPGRDERP